MKAESGSEIIPAQDQLLESKYHATKILQRESDSKCRVSKQLGEATDHIISACPILATERYIKRHDAECAGLHFKYTPGDRVQS